MSALLVTLAILAVLYGFTWHNQPARERPKTDPEPRK